MSSKTLIIGTRGSALALNQTESVKNTLLAEHPDLAVEIRIIKTTAEKFPDAALDRIGLKGLFTKDIEQQLLAGDIQLAVHSLKDLPSDSHPDLTLAALPARLDPADVLVSKDNLTLDQFPHGATVLTGSLRRTAQLKHLRPDLIVQNLRGNIHTRLDKLKNSNAHAALFAAAGLIRLNLKDRITQRLDPTDFIPAPGQGALALQTRRDDQHTQQLVETLDDPQTRTTTTAERKLMAHLQGGCQTPIGTYAHIKNNQLHLYAMIATLDAKHYLTDHAKGPTENPKQLAQQLAEKILNHGGKEILQKLRKQINPNEPRP
ncbi:MAG: hydroxymethylbilane synthase [Planctomycetes bacterium]|nr:hydroxymethylbilane synthase [Planctomycetota bacterium]